MSFLRTFTEHVIDEASCLDSPYYLASKLIVCFMNTLFPAQLRCEDDGLFCDTPYYLASQTMC